jgi:hypothetical protein
MKKFIIEARRTGTRFAVYSHTNDPETRLLQIKANVQAYTDGHGRKHERFAGFEGCSIKDVEFVLHKTAETKTFMY